MLARFNACSTTTPTVATNRLSEPYPISFPERFAKATNGQATGAAAEGSAEKEKEKKPPSNADLMADLDDDDDEEEEEQEDKGAAKDEKGAGKDGNNDGVGEWTLSNDIDWSSF